MTARDELAEALAVHGFRKWGDRLDNANWVVCLCGEKVEGSEKWQTLLAGHQADAILAAGIRKPRTITTAEELDALPFESVIADAYGTPHVCERHRTDGTRNGWRMSGNNHLINSEDVLYHGPATVLYEPEPQP